MKPSVIVLAFNSIDTLRNTLTQAREVSDDIHVVDSFSTDNTVELSRRLGAQVVQHKFENYGAQRNWAIDSLALRYSWQLHLDADERLTPELIASLRGLPENPPQSGFLIARLVQFLGREMRHGGMSPTWHLRLFRNGAGRCEERKYDQHFYLAQGYTGELKGYMIDEIRMSLSGAAPLSRKSHGAEALFAWTVQRCSAVCAALCSVYLPLFFMLGLPGRAGGVHLLDLADLLVPFFDRRQAVRTAQEPKAVKIGALCLKSS
jgi:glycosyltransferase involved in cell wall biosynthesis